MIPFAPPSCDFMRMGTTVCHVQMAGACPALSLGKKVKVKLLSHVHLFATPWTVTYHRL